MPSFKLALITAVGIAAMPALASPAAAIKYPGALNMAGATTATAAIAAS